MTISKSRKSFTNDSNTSLLDFRVHALRHQVLDDLTLALFFVYAVFPRRFNEKYASIWVSRALYHVVMSVRTAVLEAEKAEGSLTERHGTPESATAVEIDKSL